MRRHPALHQLSHDHHHGLVLALRARKGGPASPNDRWPIELAEQVEALLVFVRTELLPHFEVEEKYLVGRCTECAELDKRLLKDHMALREIISQLEAALSGEVQRQLMADFGGMLEAHIRFEEREYFPRLQEVLGDEELARLAPLLAAKHRSPDYRSP